MRRRAIQGEGEQHQPLRRLTDNGTGAYTCRWSRMNSSSSPLCLFTVLEDFHAWLPEQAPMASDLSTGSVLLSWQTVGACRFCQVVPRCVTRPRRASLHISVAVPHIRLRAFHHLRLLETLGRTGACDGGATSGDNADQTYPTRFLDSDHSDLSKSTRHVCLVSVP